MQGHELLGVTADELAALRNSDEAAFNRKVKADNWTEWHMTLAARSREYNGERRIRYTVARVSLLQLPNNCCPFSLLNEHPDTLSLFQAVV